MRRKHVSKGSYTAPLNWVFMLVFALMVAALAVIWFFTRMGLL